MPNEVGPCHEKIRYPELSMPITEKVWKKYYKIMIRVCLCVPSNRQNLSFKNLSGLKIMTSALDKMFSVSFGMILMFLNAVLVLIFLSVLVNSIEVDF
jgi:hypothetical protein